MALSYVYYLIFGGYEPDVQDLSSDLFSDKVVINFYVFSMGMKNWVGCEIRGTEIVTLYAWCSRLKNSQFTE